MTTEHKLREALMRRFAMERARNPDFYKPEWIRSK